MFSAEHQIAGDRCCRTIRGLRHAAGWDRLIAGSGFPAIDRVDQPLWDLLQEKTAIRQVLAGELASPSVLTLYRSIAMGQPA